MLHRKPFLLDGWIDIVNYWNNRNNWTRFLNGKSYLNYFISKFFGFSFFRYPCSRFVWDIETKVNLTSFLWVCSIIDSLHMNNRYFKMISKIIFFIRKHLRYVRLTNMPVMRLSIFHRKLGVIIIYSLHRFFVGNRKITS